MECVADKSIRLSSFLKLGLGTSLGTGCKSTVRFLALLVDFGLRRAHGVDAGLMAARASYIAGFAGTATVLAEKKFGIPIYWHNGAFLCAGLR